MPKVVVYVPAAAWRKLEERGLDPAATVREFARRGYELEDPDPEKAVYSDAQDVPFDPQPIREPFPEAEHFKPDFKK